MATIQGITFFSKAYGATAASALSTSTTGAIVFDKTSQAIYVNGVKYGGGLTNASFANNTLKIWKPGDAEASPSITLDFSSLATTKSVMAVFNEIADLITLDSTAGAYVSAEDASYVDADVLKALNTDNVIATTDSVADAVEKLDNKGKAIVEEVIKNEKVVTNAFGKIQETVGLEDDMSISFTPDIIASETTVKGAIEKLATDAGKIDDVKIGNDSIVTNKVANIAVDGTYNSSTNKVATQTTVTNAINDLDVTTNIQSMTQSTDAAGDVTLTFKGTQEENGKIKQGTGTDTLVLKKVATTGNAADVTVNYQAKGTESATSSDVQTAVTGMTSRIADLEALPTYDVVVLGAGEDLPTAAATTMHKIYLKPETLTSTQNIYGEYITVKNGETYSWEKLGTTAASLDGYIKTITVNGQNYTVTEGTTTVVLPEVITTITGETAIESGNTDYIAVTATPGDASSGSKEVTISSTLKIQSIESAGESAKGLAEASDVKDYVDTAAAVDNKDATITVNAADATTIATIGTTNVTAKVALVWEEWE